MNFTFTIGTFFLSVVGFGFVLLVRIICKNDMVPEEIGIIDKFMLVSVFLHLGWALAVGLLSKAGYQYLVWDDEAYHNFAMNIITGTHSLGSNLYSYVLRSLYTLFGKTTVTGRLTNLFVSVATLYPLATIEKRLNQDTRYSATKFFAYSPFMIFISYFEIKDIIVMFCFIASYAIVKKLQEKISLVFFLLLIAVCSFSEQFRTGTGALPVFLFILSKLHGLGSTKKQRIISSVINTAIVIALGFYVGQDYIVEGTDKIARYQSWIFTQFSGTSIYNTFVITKWTDIWKAPFCFLLYALQPLDVLSGDMRYFSEFGMIAKIMDVPILFFSILLLPIYIRKEKWNSLFFIVLYAFSSCINLTNARQGFFLYPIMYLIFFDGLLSFETADYTSKLIGFFRNKMNWKQFIGVFYVIWIIFVVSRL